MAEMKVGLTEDKNHVVYELKTIQEVMHFLKELGTDKSKALLQKLICPNPRKEPRYSELEFKLRTMTEAERKAILYGASLPKDSETLQILNKLCGEVNSEN